MTGLLDLEHVDVHHRGVVAVDGVSLTVGPGEWVGVIGANGAGKSSLLRAVTGVVASHGRIRVDGHDLAGLSRRRRAQLVASVPQQPELPAAMPVLDYALLGRTPHLGPFAAETDRDRAVAESLLDRLGLAALAGRPLSTLSGGEAQRAVLARALAQDAPVLLLDEPTSALDLGRRVEALDLVDALRRERALGVLSALHDLTLAAQFADRLVLLAAGRVVASGPPREVLTADVLSAAFGVDVRVWTADDGTLLVVPQRRT